MVARGQEPSERLLMSLLDPLRSLRALARRPGAQPVAPLVPGALDAGADSVNADAELRQRLGDAIERAERAEAELLASRKREALGHLTGGISHDFNNLLQAISTGLYVVDRTTGNGPHRTSLEAAMRASAKAASLVQQLLAFTRASPPAARAVSLHDFVLQTLDLTRRAVGHGIELVVQVEPALPNALVDAMELELAFLNLVFNARDALTGGGRIEIRLRRASPQELQAAGSFEMVVLEVSDDGPGMDAATLARATDAFFTTKPIGAGSGLGLARVQSFARASGGDLLLRSLPGQGTAAAILLPVAQEPASSEHAATQRPARGTPQSVLLVEDDLLVATVLRSALEAEGHLVTVCHDAASAQHRLTTQEPFDVLVADIVMPGPHDGEALVQWCAEHRPDIRQVLATGYRVRNAPAGVPVLQKPYPTAALLQAMQPPASPHDLTSPAQD